MSRITKHGKKMRLAYITATALTCAVLAVAFPWFKGLDNREYNYYVVEYNGEVVGAVGSVEEAEKAYLDARQQLVSNSDSKVYLDDNFTVTEKAQIVGSKDSVEVVQDRIYNLMSNAVIDVQKEVYVVDIDGLVITLDSLEDVTALLNASMKAFDENALFHAEVLASNDRCDTFVYNLVMAETDMQGAPTVMVGEDETGAIVETVLIGKDGVFSMNFKENITIATSYASNDEVWDINEAISTVTKETEEKEIYEVVSGDTLSAISKKFDLTIEQIIAMNDYLKDSDYLHVGDQIVVTVPKPEISVIVEEQQSYTENYDLPIKYVYNEKKYTTYSETLEEAVSGVRDVVAIVTYENGVETGREIIQETIIEEAKAAVIEVGTKTPPTYIKPISGGRLTSRYGWRTIFGERDFHKGVDWACPVGTTVRASSSGKVIKAGWGGSYGYYVLIEHADGSRTRYAHLSKILVKKGQKVKQGEKIAKTGNTGRSTGPHIHFEIIINGSTVNPLKYVDK